MRPDPVRSKLVNPQCEGGAREPRVLRIAATWQASCLRRGAAGQRQLGCGRVWLRLQIQVVTRLRNHVISHLFYIFVCECRSQVIYRERERERERERALLGNNVHEGVYGWLTEQLS